MQLSNTITNLLSKIGLLKNSSTIIEIGDNNQAVVTKVEKSYGGKPKIIILENTDNSRQQLCIDLKEIGITNRSVLLDIATNEMHKLDTDNKLTLYLEPLQNLRLKILKG